MKQFPGDLEGDERLARAGGEGEQDAPLRRGDGLQNPFHGNVLVVSAEVRSALILKRNGGEPVAPQFGKLTGLVSRVSGP